ncbi:kelch-like ECH-associated protein 1 [Passer montanus]|uniref:kelch-like ECH-associated protein 1 n=1 Tax=Passer montanus TaxID=9160 RepID=UPI00195F7D32|nr:kelch-like ECH-associated protein 1 [Passer montanus]
MFTAGLRERGLAEVPIEGVQPRAMERLVEFAYTAAVAVGERCVLPLLHGALMYQVSKQEEFLSLSHCQDTIFAHFYQFLPILPIPPGVQAGGVPVPVALLGYNFWVVFDPIFTNSDISPQVSKQEEFLSLSHCQYTIFGLFFEPIFTNFDLFSPFPQVSKQEEFLSLSHCQYTIFGLFFDPIFTNSDISPQGSKQEEFLSLSHCQYTIFGLFFDPIFTNSDISPQGSKQEEFLSLSHCQLAALLSRDELNVRGECEVFQACLAWVQQDRAARAPFLPALLRAVRCHALPPRFLRAQLRRRHLGRDALRYLAQVFRELSLHRPSGDRPPGRTPGVRQLIYAAGGYLGRSVGTLEALEPEGGRWVRLAEMEAPRSGLGGCVVGGLFYAVGGRNNSAEGNTDSAAVDCYNPVSGRWAPCAPMSVPRNRIGVGVIDGLIYAVGGSHGGTHLRSVERYEPERDAWAPVAPMGTRRIGLGVAVLHRLLYAVGGFDGSARLRSAERYHPERDSWQPIPPMAAVRSGAGVCALGNCLYAMGGYDGTQQLSSAERFRPDTDTWSFVAPMGHRRSALGATAFRGRIYVLGGYDGHSFLDSVECYDPEADAWTEVAPMPSGRSGLGVAVTMEPCHPQETPPEDEEPPPGGPC